LQRLQLVTYPDPDGSEAYVLAEIAIRAGDDTLAHQIVEAQLAAARTPLRRSEVLEAAVSLFTDPIISTGDSVRDVARDAVHYAIATGYAAALGQIRVTRYDTRRDSISVANRQVVTPLRIATASTRIGRYPVVLRDLDKALAAAHWVTPEMAARMFYFFFPLQDAVTLVLAQPNSSTIPDTLSQFKKALAISPQLGEQFARAMLPGQPAPTLAAHAWLNTADSLYAPTPREHHLADGALHLIVFTFAPNLAIVERLHERFPAVHTILMTATDGTLGEELVDLPTEMGALIRFLRERQHVTFTVGVWSGPKQPNKYGGTTPEPSPMRELFYADRNTCLIVDGHGIIRKVMSIRSRTDEANVAKALSALTASSSDTAPVSAARHTEGTTR